MAHGTETALLNVTYSLRPEADLGQASILILLDSSTAFNTIDHNIVFQKLDTFNGLLYRMFFF